MKKVLIALDYNPTAQKVAEQGFELATAMKAEIILLHVITDPAYYASAVYSPIMGFGGFNRTDMLPLETVNELTKSSHNFLEKTRHHLGDESIVTVVKEGNVSEVILEAAKDLFVNVIVLGSHSQRWLEKIIMGSNTEKVLHHTNVPLFIIPTKN
ncbi:MAG: universal stress protein [Deinococcales bacterium]|nr:universal stress protein [Chitinophagaceae bacterium]